MHSYPEQNMPDRRRRLQRPAAAALLAVAAALGGCASQPQPIYQWESYQSQVYEYLKGQSSDPQKQIAAMEEDYQKIQAHKRKSPPGFHAHLGLLYASVGKDDVAVQQFQTEKALFPESTPYMDMLLAKAKTGGSKEKAL